MALFEPRMSKKMTIWAHFEHLPAVCSACGRGKAHQMPYTALAWCRRQGVPDDPKKAFYGLPVGKEGAKMRCITENLPLSFFRRGSDRNEGPGGSQKDSLYHPLHGPTRGLQRAGGVVGADGRQKPV